MSVSTKLVKPSQRFIDFVKEFAQEEIVSESENEIKKDYWSKMKTELEVAGYTENMIGRTIHDYIEEEIWQKKFKELGVPREQYKWHSGYFYRWCKKEGISQIYNNTPLGDSSINTPKKVTPLIIQRLHFTKEICDLIIDKLEEYPDIMEFFQREELAEFFSQWNTILQINKDASDEKTKIPTNTQHLLLECLATESSLTHGAKVFLKMRVKMMELANKFLTAKQATKFQNGEIDEQLFILQPKTRDEAIFLNYTGQQCSECKSFCMREFTDGTKTKVRCIMCHNSEDPITVTKCRFCQIPLYKESLLYIIDNGACQNCNSEITLPAELVSYARS